MRGTYTVKTDNIVGRHMESGKDDSSLGRWTYICIAVKDDRELCVIIGYRPCKQSNAGSGTVNAQQQCLLTMRGNPDAKDRKEWDKTILSCIKQWKNEKAEIVLMVDTYEGLEERVLGELISIARMHNLMGEKHGHQTPNTHIDESRAIEYIFRTKGVDKAAKR
eukprot:15347742-Ditylum_brightwellii.AAC.1